LKYILCLSFFIGSFLLSFLHTVLGTHSLTYLHTIGILLLRMCAARSNRIHKHTTAFPLNLGHFLEDCACELGKMNWCVVTN